ncbi:hypothetical protein [Bradyrhizobium sp. RT9a]|uniref:hypothetical protein n=1 Tax=Bradyrhizobium sp. RT9a TaxID=3156384 RepID=UPI003396029B
MKITFGEMREMGMRGAVVFCADYRSSHSVALLADHWPDDTKLSDLEARFVCGAGERRPDFFWNGPPTPSRGYRDNQRRGLAYWPECHCPGSFPPENIPRCELFGTRQLRLSAAALLEAHQTAAEHPVETDPVALLAVLGKARPANPRRRPCAQAGGFPHTTSGK